MLNDRPVFQIIYIVANEIDLLSITLPCSIDALTKNSNYKYEIVLQVDGASDESLKKILELRNKLHIDEIRIRRRESDSLLCPGDPSNNSHFHTLASKSKYTIEIESDVIAVLSKSDFDALGEIVSFFERHPEVCLASSTIDYDCWVWKLEDIGPCLEKNIRNVNRISSHFLIYHNQRFLDFAEANGIYSFDKYTDDYNYEDVVSNLLVTNNRPIAFFDPWEVKIRHCDEKKYEGSLYYKRHPKLKVKIANEMIRNYTDL